MPAVIVRMVAFVVLRRVLELVALIYVAGELEEVDAAEVAPRRHAWGGRRRLGSVLTRWR